MAETRYSVGVTRRSASPGPVDDVSGGAIAWRVVDCAKVAHVGANTSPESPPALPETRDELLAIAAALGADAQHVLRLGREATRESVLQASADGQFACARTVAFATHGLVAGDLPGFEQPALALSAQAAAAQAASLLGSLLQLDESRGAPNAESVL